MKKITANTASNSHLKANLNSAINLPRDAYANQRYNTPVFVLFEMFKAFQRHNAFGLSASLSFYAMFALIPLVLLMFFLLSQLVFSSDYAIVKLAIITGNLVPQLSSAIMVEVYNTANQKAAWGALGLFVLLWSITPLASSMRAAFYNIASLVEAPSFVKRKVKDIFAILGMLLLFFLFTFAGLMLEKVLAFLGASNQLLEHGILATLISLILTTILIATFYLAFFPVRLNVRHIIIGALFTAILWLLMRPAFTLFLSVNQSYGALFGGMKNLFISITWLYFNFAVFLLGTELIATLRKKDVLLLKGLFENNITNQLTGKVNYIKRLMQSYGKTYNKDDYVFRYGDTSYQLYYLLSGEIQLIHNGKLLRSIAPGSYFGEMAMLSNTPTIADALVASETADVIIINTDNIETLLLDEPKVAMQFLRQLANRLQRHEE
ncbi:MAG: cyclic nucleotide-binding protein [Methylotenera sp. 24-45-7]|jgi:membrane protein|nr:MAG: cyclic nucleotide-binding protein [Methylotenera sp. 24-45-7]OZA08100.1 MAG: cyclic nucleotide-binding protein [Methylotenera sp. 17-45-7]OZA51046.1 MAG: cyclic nucleotide-binding protein [Methylophilales bacterium 39-45-7]HQS38018.1 YhjD/YihY/BrkB family envelope integrity protein [Methylotenera sp.]HQS44648.1 YhjD/YihY/BrkB family envelope integrity protein [Methylotenera sp.]